MYAYVCVSSSLISHTGVQIPLDIDDFHLLSFTAPDTAPFPEEALSNSLSKE